jgi:hypothetical protein
VERWLDGFIKAGMERVLGGLREGAMHWGVPSHAEPIDIEESITGGYLSLGSGFSVGCWIMREELGKIVLMDLFSEGMGRS